jgi:hypothetical protein
LFGLVIGVGMSIGDPEYDGSTWEKVHPMLKLAMIGAGIMVVVIILAFINKALPSNCLTV